MIRLIVRRHTPFNQPATDLYVSEYFQTLADALEAFDQDKAVSWMRWTYPMFVEENGVRSWLRRA